MLGDDVVDAAECAGGEALTLRNLDSFLASGELVTPVPLPAAASG